MATIGDLRVGDRVQFNTAGLPDYKIDSQAGEYSWQDYFGGEPGIVEVVDARNDTVAVRSDAHSVYGHPFLVWIGPEHLTKTA